MALRQGELPPDAGARLRAAAAEPDPRKRRIAIDKASAWVKATYPELFRKETNMKITLTNVRIAFPSLFEPSSIDGGDPKYGVKIIIDPADKVNIAKIAEAEKTVAAEKWKEKAAKYLELMNRTGRKPDTFYVAEPYKSREGEPYAGFEDMHYATALSATRPLVIDRDRSPLIAADGKPYGGAICNVQIEVYPQDNTFGRGIRAQLKGVQFVKDAPAFSGGAPASADDFDDLSVDDEGDLT